MIGSHSPAAQRLPAGQSVSFWQGASQIDPTQVAPGAQPASWVQEAWQLVAPQAYGAQGTAIAATQDPSTQLAAGVPRSPVQLARPHDALG